MQIDASPSPALLGVPTPGMARIATLPALLAPSQLVLGARACRRSPLTALLAWGRKPSGRRAEALARQRGLPLWRCEDGFLRSLGGGADGPPLSLVVDDLGIYYDASAPSRLERLIATPAGADQRQRAEALRTLWCRERVSKYNGAPEAEPPAEPFVLVVDQTAGDLSISGGLAEPASFRQMLAAALAEHPGAVVLVKVHPEVAAGRRRGHFSAAELAQPRVRVCADGGHPVALLERALAVYVVTSQLGFEALLHGRPVHCFGMPFYAGWGLTHDRLPAPERRRSALPPDLTQLVHAALVRYPRWIEPHGLEHCEPEVLIAAIGLQLRQRRALPGQLEAFGIKPWKRAILRRFLAGSRLRFRRRNGRPGARCRAAVIWGRDPGQGLARRLAEPDPPQLLRVEDGFLRSVGLGAELIAPISWVVDQRGLYYDAGGPSDLEHYLAEHRFTPAERQRAAALRRRLVAENLTKYNLSGPTWRRPAGQRRVVLVPGQVESDASIRWGAPQIRSNAALLAAVRRAEPDAWIVWKPHPDLVAGLRGDRSAGEPPPGCDEVIRHGAISDIYAGVDAVHVLTSLAGFEALLRGVEVHTWGLPFYAGWGLTHDRLSCPRRGRRLELDELVMGCLIAYPRYVSRRSGLFLEAEAALEDLLAWRAEPTRPPRAWQRLFRHWGRWRERWGWPAWQGSDAAADDSQG